MSGGGGAAAASVATCALARPDGPLLCAARHKQPAATAALHGTVASPIGPTAQVSFWARTAAAHAGNVAAYAALATISTTV